jgi:hypothetical protein
MKKYNIYFWAGLLIYVASFFLVAAVNAGNTASRDPVRGYTCAWLTVFFSLGSISKGPSPILTPCSLLSGLINPVFIAAVIASLIGSQGILKILRITVFALFPFPWVIFLFMGMLPREGYYFWTLSMLIVLLSASPQGSSNSSSRGLAAPGDGQETRRLLVGSRGQSNRGR